MLVPPQKYQNQLGSTFTSEAQVFSKMSAHRLTVFGQKTVMEVSVRTKSKRAKTTLKTESELFFWSLFLKNTPCKRTRAKFNYSETRFLPSCIFSPPSSSSRPPTLINQNLVLSLYGELLRVLQQHLDIQSCILHFGSELDYTAESFRDSFMLRIIKETVILSAINEGPEDSIHKRMQGGKILFDCEFTLSFQALQIFRNFKIPIL